MHLLRPTRLIGLRRHPILGPTARRLLRYTSAIEVPADVEIGEGLVIHHGYGLVVHPFTRIGRNVHLFQGVTIGRADVWIPRAESDFEGVDIDDEAWICTGAVVIGREGRLRVGRGTIVGANSVLAESTGDWEIWAGAPARKVGKREPGSIPAPDTAGARP